MLTANSFQDDFECYPQSLEEARYLLELASAERNSRRAAKELAELQLLELQSRIQLTQLRAEEASRHLQEADLRLGKIRHLVRQSGHVQALKPATTPMRRRVKKLDGTFSTKVHTFHFFEAIHRLALH
jgi:hypothetical protein